MAENPDNANLPVTNRPETILGTTITFLFIAWSAISLRLYVRFRERIWGWDDLFVFLAGLSTIAGSSLTCLMPAAGMGKHFWTLNLEEIMDYFKHVWGTNVTYCSSTMLIKLAILFQYLRLFDMQNVVARRITKGFIVLVACWGITFFFLALLACIPIEKNWNFTLPGRCVAWGSKKPDVFFTSFAAHSASNMLLDILILGLPIPFLRGLRMSGKTKLGIISLFTMGGIVAVLSVARMFALSLNRAGTVPVFDPSYAAPAVYIFSVLEINLAILCASIPIFWPFVTSLAVNKILVVNEVEIRTDPRDSQNINLAEQGARYDGIHDGVNDGRTSRMSVIMGGKMSRSNSKHHKHKASYASSRSRHGPPIELGRRISQESSRNLAHQQSNGSLSDASPEHAGPLTVTRSASNRSGEKHYQDRYVQDWVCPDFDKQTGVGNAFTTTVERAQIPFDHIRALEK